MDFAVALANGKTGDAIELLLEDGNLLKCEIPPEEYMRSAKYRKRVERTLTLTDEERARVRTVLTADEWEEVQRRRAEPSRAFDKRVEAAEALFAQYLLSRCHYFHVFGTRYLSNFGM
jgi:hypothetical protein